MFGASGAPAASVPDAVAASCAIPGVFAPVRIAGREYVDGGVMARLCVTHKTSPAGEHRVAGAGRQKALDTSAGVVGVEKANCGVG